MSIEPPDFYITIEKDGGSWYLIDQDGEYVSGPHDSFDDAQDQLDEYNTNPKD